MTFKPKILIEITSRVVMHTYIDWKNDANNKWMPIFYRSLSKKTEKNIPSAILFAKKYPSENGKKYNLVLVFINKKNPGSILEKKIKEAKRYSAIEIVSEEVGFWIQIRDNLTDKEKNPKLAQFSENNHIEYYGKDGNALKLTLDEISENNYGEDYDQDPNILKIIINRISTKERKSELKSIKSNTSDEAYLFGEALRDNKEYYDLRYGSKMKLGIRKFKNFFKKAKNTQECYIISAKGGLKREKIETNSNNSNYNDEDSDIFSKDSKNKEKRVRIGVPNRDSTAEEIRTIKKTNTNKNIKQCIDKINSNLELRQKLLILCASLLVISVSSLISSILIIFMFYKHEEQIIEIIKQPKLIIFLGLITLSIIAILLFVLSCYLIYRSRGKLCSLEILEKNKINKKNEMGGTEYEEDVQEKYEDEDEDEDETKYKKNIIDLKNKNELQKLTHKISNVLKNPIILINIASGPIFTIAISIFTHQILKNFNKPSIQSPTFIVTTALCVLSLVVFIVSLGVVFYESNTYKQEKIPTKLNKSKSENEEEEEMAMI